MPRAGLSAEKLVAAAGDMADRDGLESVSLSALADQLGVRVPSLYKHVAGLDDLRRRLAADGTAGLLAALRRGVRGKQGRAALIAVGTAYRRYARAHPGRYQALQRAPRPGDEHADDAARIVELLSDVLAGYGVSGPHAVHAVRGLRSTLHGFVDLERIGGFGMPASVSASFTALLDTLDRGLR